MGCEHRCIGKTMTSAGLMTQQDLLSLRNSEEACIKLRTSTSKTYRSLHRSELIRNQRRILHQLDNHRYSAFYQKNLLPNVHPNLPPLQMASIQLLRRCNHHRSLLFLNPVCYPYLQGPISWADIGRAPTDSTGSQSD